MSADAAILSPPPGTDPVALHATKLRAMVTDIRANHPDKGGRDNMPWSEIAGWINNNPDVLGVQYNYAPGSIRQWHSGKDASTQAMLSNMSAYCIAHSGYQARELRADARNMKRGAGDGAGATAEASADSFTSPVPKRVKWGPGTGSHQAATPVTINNIVYLTPPKHVIIAKAQESKYKRSTWASCSSTWRLGRARACRRGSAPRQQSLQPRRKPRPSRWRRAGRGCPSRARSCACAWSRKCFRSCPPRTASKLWCAKLHSRQQQQTAGRMRGARWSWSDQCSSCA